jgi:predicted tellurium resistance membrane protein TerC
MVLAIGIATTIPLVVYGSTLLTSLLDRFPILVYAGAGQLVYIAVEMFFDDEAAGEHLEPYANFEGLIGLGAVALFVAVAWLWAKRTGEAEQAEEGSDDP